MKRASFVSQFVVDKGVTSHSWWWLTLKNNVIYSGRFQVNTIDMLPKIYKYIQKSNIQ